MDFGFEEDSSQDHKKRHRPVAPVDIGNLEIKALSINPSEDKPPTFREDSSDEETRKKHKKKKKSHKDKGSKKKRKKPLDIQEIGNPESMRSRGNKL